VSSSYLGTTAATRLLFNGSWQRAKSQAHGPVSHVSELRTACALPSSPLRNPKITVQSPQHLRIVPSVTRDWFPGQFLQRKDENTSGYLRSSIASGCTTKPLLAKLKKTRTSNRKDEGPPRAEAVISRVSVKRQSYKKERR
jgi:hypothetical protein